MQFLADQYDGWTPRGVRKGQGDASGRRKSCSICSATMNPVLFMHRFKPRRNRTFSSLTSGATSKPTGIPYNMVAFSVWVPCLCIPCGLLNPPHLVLPDSPTTFFREKSGLSHLLTYAVLLEETRRLVRCLRSTLQGRRSKKNEQ